MRGRSDKNWGMGRTSLEFVGRGRKTTVHASTRSQPARKDSGPWPTAHHPPDPRNRKGSRDTGPCPHSGGPHRRTPEIQWPKVRSVSGDGMLLQRSSTGRGPSGTKLGLSLPPGRPARQRSLGREPLEIPSSAGRVRRAWPRTRTLSHHPPATGHPDDGDRDGRSPWHPKTSLQEDEGGSAPRRRSRKARTAWSAFAHRSPRRDPSSGTGW